MNKLRRYIAELKRRNVIRAGVAYLVVAWLITQVISIVLPAFGAPPNFLKTALIILGIGFPIWLVFSWIYEFTPEGLKKTDEVRPEESISHETGSKLNRIIILSLLITIVVLVVDRFLNREAHVLDVGEKSIAVLAFADMSPNKDHEYFSDGISEELLNMLTRVQDLKVISRTSSFSYKGKNVTATEIGKELDVSHILEGSIRKAGNTVRVTAKLINTQNGEQEWSRTFDRDLDSIFKIQDDIAAEVLMELKLSLLGEEAKSEKVDTKAYNLVLQANHLTRLNKKESLIRAKEMVEKAIEIDSNYARAWSLLAEIYDYGTYNFDIWEPEEGIPLGLNAIERSIQLNPDSGQSYASLASLQELNWDFTGASKSIEKALELDPTNASIIGSAAIMTYGDLEKSIRLQEKAISLDPLVYANYFNLGFSNYRLNKLDEAEEAFEKFELYYPSWQILHYMKAMIKMSRGEYDLALQEIEKETHEFFNLYGKNFIYEAMGNEKISDSLFQEYLEKYEITEPANTADLYAFRGEFDKSFELLNKAYEVKDPVLIEALSYPAFKMIHADPRWRALLEKINLPEDHGIPVE